ncbi:hypothetical protein BC834DRAFT_84828 [Gloeopeniophorella convolvens]|nr:hypothetical protein BC834DRAFT_84828 [Gloeopeniophorella convolvens]
MSAATRPGGGGTVITVSPREPQCGVCSASCPTDSHVRWATGPVPRRRCTSRAQRPLADVHPGGRTQYRCLCLRASLVCT